MPIIFIQREGLFFMVGIARNHWKTHSGDAQIMIVVEMTVGNTSFRGVIQATRSCHSLIGFNCGSVDRPQCKSTLQWKLSIPSLINSYRSDIVLGTCVWVLALKTFEGPGHQQSILYTERICHAGLACQGIVWPALTHRQSLDSLLSLSIIEGTLVWRAQFFFWWYAASAQLGLSICAIYNTRRDRCDTRVRTLHFGASDFLLDVHWPLDSRGREDGTVGSLCFWTILGNVPSFVAVALADCSFRFFHRA